MVESAFSIKAMVRGYHIYRDIWTAVVVTLSKRAIQCCRSFRCRCGEGRHYCRPRSGGRYVVSFSDSGPLVSGRVQRFSPIAVKSHLVNAAAPLDTGTAYKTCYDVTISPPIQNFAVLIFAAANLSAKNAKVCTMQKFPAIRYIDCWSSCMRAGVHK